MSKKLIEKVNREKEMKKQNHLLAMEYRRHLRIQSLKVICLFVGIGSLLGLTAYLALN
jgi:hypothetical protein